MSVAFIDAEIFALLGFQENTWFFVHLVLNPMKYTDYIIHSFFENIQPNEKIVIYDFYDEFNCFDILVLYPPTNPLPEHPVSRKFLTDAFFDLATVDRRFSEHETIIIVKLYGEEDFKVNIVQERVVFVEPYREKKEDFYIRQTKHRIL
jgi:hypothetical protein